jgi:hypothetical protein
LSEGAHADERQKNGGQKRAMEFHDDASLR